MFNEFSKTIHEQKWNINKEKVFLKIKEVVEVIIQCVN